MSAEKVKGRFSARGRIVLDNEYADTPLHVLCEARSGHAADAIRRAMNQLALRHKLGRKKKEKKSIDS